MAKFVFRSLAREHVDPGEFLAAANEVVSSEIAPGRFITMVELVIDAAKGEVACASAGHPATAAGAAGRHRRRRSPRAGSRSGSTRRRRTRR